MLAIARGYENIIRQIPENEMPNKHNFLHEMTTIKRLFPDASKPKPLNAPMNLRISVENIGIFNREIKKVHTAFEDYFNKRLPVPSKNPIKFQVPK